ncbi:SdrD B-like domain-containing protein [Arcicella sp. LKC2W]|uniref:SdrD B-like domain-containing protein n=1 Tax=Arcicella sp. LKC2W TaxID=2984198 RepID=UPI002B20BC76|nr:SdrD B-like domain-containing protein [Arcicella sp. LKC2W]MEA5460979.1 SdrD B-like domain-containing protein [Arcicella sp. LKC2W]
MEGTSTFTDGASNQTNLTISLQPLAKKSAFLVAKDLFRKVKKLFIQEEISESLVETVFMNEPINTIQPQPNAVVESAIPAVVVKQKSQFSHTNYQLNIQQMNLFTYLRRAITSSEESLSGQFLEKFKNFLSVIVGTAPDNNAPLGFVKRDFGILSQLGGSQLLSSKSFNHQSLRTWMGVVFLTLFTAFGALSQGVSLTTNPDLSVKKTIDNQSPALGTDVTYTIKVNNAGAAATGVELTDVLPDGVTFKSVNVSGVGSTSNTTVAGVTSIKWNIGNVSASADLTMTVVATVTSRGLSFNIAQITKENEVDYDSSPNNNDLNEDDQDAVCLSVADYFYQGDEFKIGLPVGYTNIAWTIKVGTGAATAITANTPGVSLNAAKDTLTVSSITAYTEFAFTATNKNCPATGCCPAKFIPGPLGSISDYVFKDYNGDGKQDLGESGNIGVKVILYKADGITKLDSTITDNNGKYIFDSLLTGTYKVRFGLLPGQSFSPSKAAGTTDINDSDAGTDGFTSVISIDVEKTGKDKDNFDIDAGVIGNVGSIGDFVWRDDNSNGIQDLGEPGIAGVVVNLYKGTAFQTSITTDVNGKYTFGNLTSGAYQVEFVAPAQSKFTNANQGTDDTKDSDVGAAGKSQIVNIDITKATTDTLRNNPQIDAGIIPLGSIGDYVFNDNNKDGIQNAGDTPVAGVKVYLLDKDGNKIDSTETGVNGKYNFFVPSGDYYVQFTKQPGQSYSPTGAGTSSTDSDADVTTGKSGKITIDASKPVGDPARDNSTVDAGLIGNLGSIGDFVWRDDNSNGIQDLGEPGIAGVVVNLYKGTAFQTSTTTDANGIYNFGNLTSGAYQVEFVAPTQSKFTNANQGTNDTKDSDVGAAGKSQIINIDVTKAATDTLRNNPQIDAGIIPLGSIGDYVFNDNNGNGIQDAGDTPIVGLIVTLTDKNGVVLASYPTDADGKYEFIVPAGQYIVVFNKPAGSTFSPTGAGTTATDSDAGADGKSGIITIDTTKPVNDPARNNTTIDAGLIPNKGTIGDYVWTDANGNNKQDVGETGVSGVTVELYDGTGTTKLKSTITDATGKYFFNDLESGAYKVKFILPSGKTFVTPNTGTTTEDSDAGVGGFSGVINIDVTKPLGDIGRNNLTIDAGIKADCNINAGTLATTTPNFCLPAAGSVILEATTATAPTVPTGYSVKYVLTQGTNLVIQQIANAPTFTVNAAGDYTIHTLVFDNNSANGSYLDLSTVVLGTTKASDLLSTISTNNLCAALDATGTKFKVGTIPAGPQVAGGTICAGGSITLGTPNVSDPVYHWFNVITGGTPFATSSSVTVSPTFTTNYYVSTLANTPNACESLRTKVTVTVNAKPNNPVAKSSISNDCTRNLQTVNLADAITTIPTGATIEWHVSNSVNSAIVTNTTAVGAGTYYAFAKSTAGCYSAAVAVTVIINSCVCADPATVSIAPLAAICGNTTTPPVQLSATIGGGATSGTWTSNGTGTFDNTGSLTAKYSPSAGDIANGSVELTFTTNDPDGTDIKCSAASAKVILTIKAKPQAPYNLKCDTLVCLGESSKLFAVSQGNIVKWYSSLTSNTPLIVLSTDDEIQAGFTPTAPNAEGVYTYYAEATTLEGCISERSSISFRVKKCFTDLAVIKKIVDAPDAQSAPSYLLGQTITYSIEAQNLGTAKATDVKIVDILPVGATYVSSTPSGEYNTTTGTWTIGDLTAGSTKALLIQVTLGKVGSVVNTAEISGSNEDPTKKDNNISTVTINVIDIADLSLTKTVSKTEVNVGETVEYTITVLNSGPNTATNVEVKDKLPAGLTFVSSSTLTENAGTLTGTVASLAKGTSTNFTFKAKVMASGKIKNMAEVSKSDQKDPDSTPNNASTKPDEDDDDSVEINSTLVCNLEKPTIACGCTQKSICLGGSVTLTATGCENSTFVWSNGDLGASITVSPKTNQTYTVYCKKDDCKSESSNAVEVKVIVVDSPLLSAAPSKICAGESTTLTAKGCGGVVEWQTSPKQTGPQITVNPTVSTTYKAVCKEFECVSPEATVDVIVTPTPNAPTIVCAKGEICPGETITLTAINCNGQVKWSTGQETTTITVFPTTTTNYTATCSFKGCTSAVSTPYVLTVKPIDVPIIKTSDLIVCVGGSATLTAEGCTGKVTWYYGDKNETGATIIVKPTTTTIYYATCSSTVCHSDKSAPVTVQVVNPAPPIVSSGTSTICAGSSVDLTATGCESGIVTWSDGQKGSVITVKPLVSTSYTATCSIGTCVSEASIKRNITVTDFAKPTITADKLTVCVGQSITLTANGCNGTVKWSDGVTGSPRTITPTADVKYTATCESTTCKSDNSNELSVKVNTAGPAPVVSCAKTEICAGESVTLTAAGCEGGTVKWSDNSTGTSITVKPSVTTIYTAKCVTNTCESVNSNETKITVNPAVVLNLTASASNDKICAGTEVTLTLAGCTTGTVTWTGGSTGATIKVKPTETTTYTATCTGVACAKDASASVKVTVLPGATTPNITPTNTQICAGAEVTLTANNCNGTLLWSNGATTATITVKPSITTIYSVQCKVEGCGESKTSEPVTVKVGTPDAPTVVSTPPSVCAGGSVVLTATGCTSGTVVWSNGKTGVSISETVNATTTYSAVCKLGTCNSPESNKVTVTVTIPSVPTISCATSTICAGSTVTLVASGCEGTVKWSDGQTGTIVTTAPTVTTDYTATCTIGTCTSAPSSVATVNVGNPPAPHITCNATSICQGIQITLTASGCDGTVIWNDGQVGNVITAKPNATTKYTAICKFDKCESGKSNDVTVTVGAGLSTPKTKNLTNVCPFLTVDLASGVTSGLSAGGTFEYHTGVLPSSPLVSSPNAVGTGTYYVFEKTASGCYSAPGVINTYINTDCTPKDCAKTPSTVSAGADATICAEKVYKLSGTFGGAATSVTWTTTGTGTFDNPMLPTATYRSSLADVLAGTVKLIVTTNDPDGTGTCKAAADTMVLTMQGVKFKPLVSIKGNLTTCGTDTVTLTATAGNYGYKWFKVGSTTEIASTRSITVASSGSYYFKLVDANKCCSIESDTATVNYLIAPSAPVANSVKIDRGTTVDLSKLVVSNTPTGATLVFKTGANANSTTVANPSAVGAGIYYACYKSAQGCFSGTTKITVENKAEVTSPTDSDIEIVVTTENNIALDSTVKVTIKVTNKGPATAKGVSVSSPIPTGLTFVSQTGGLVRNGSLLSGSIDSLISGGVKIYTWIGKISGTTTSVTVGATGGSNNPDPNPNNNNGSNPGGSSTVTVPSPNSSDIVVTITTDKINYAVGDTVTTTITVRNLGPATAKNVTISSAIPDKLTYVSQTGGLTKTGSVLTGKLDSLVKDGVKVYIYKSVLNGAGPVVIGGTGTSNNPDPNPNNNNGTGTGGSVTINPTLPSGADVVVTITTDKSNYAVGDTVTTTITVKNLGPQTAKGINVSSTLPSILEYIGQTGGLAKAGSVLSASLDSLGKDSVKVYTFKAKVIGNGTTTITASSTSTTTDPNPTNNSGSGSGGATIVVGSTTQTGADVVITITTDKASYAKGETITTTITVTNLGPQTAKGINIASVIPGTFTYVSQTGGLVKNGSLLTATLDSLIKGGVKVYTYTATLNTDVETTIAAGGTSITADPNPSNNNGSGAGKTIINVGKVDNTVADVAVVITSDKTTAKVGENVNFLLTLTNNGPATAKQVVLTNAIPAGMTFVSSSTGQTLTSGAVTVSLDSLLKGQTRTYAYVATMNVKSNVTNTVSVNSLLDNVGPNNFSFVTINGDTTTVVTPPAGTGKLDLALAFTADKQLTALNDEVTFTLTVKNNGPAIATNVVVDNLLPKHLSFVSGDPAKNGDTLRVAIVSIPVGSSQVFTYKAKVAKDTIIYNTAKITKTTPTDSILTNNVTTVVLVPANDTTYADLGVLITANKATYKKGENVTYTVTLTNNGAGKAKDVKLCNPLPSGLTYVSGTGVVKAGDSLTIAVDTISKGSTRTFTYITTASNSGTIANTVKICNTSKVDLITTNNSSTSTITVRDTSVTVDCKLGLAMAVIDTAKVSEGVYNVTYRLIAKNFCKDTLRNVTLTSNLASTFKTPVTCEIVGKPNTGVSTNLIVNDAFSKTDSSLVKVGSFMLPGASDTVKYVVKVTLNGNKGPFFSQATVTGVKPDNTVLTAKSSDGANVNGTPSRTVLRFDLPNTRIGVAKEVVVTALKNDSTTFWTVPYRIRVVNMGATNITKLSVKDSLDAVFTAKGAVIVGTPILIATPGLKANPNYTGKGANTDLLLPEESTLLKGDTAIIDLTVRVNTAGSTDAENIFNNVAVGTATGTDNATYKDISTNGNNPDSNGDKDPSNDNVATPVQLKNVVNSEVSIGLALASQVDTIPLADSTYNVTLIMTAKNYGRVGLAKVRLCTNIGNTIGQQVEAWKLVGTPRVVRGNATINSNFNGRADSTLTKTDSTFLAVGDSIVVAYMVNVKRPVNDTIFTQGIAKAVSALDSTKSTSDISVNGINPDLNGDGKPDEATPTPIIFKGAVILSELFIPQGFSPNGDGTNDKFVIQGVNKATEKVELIIFNRWGGVVYASQDYENDWAGAANQGVKVVGDGQGLPDGTYFYCVTRSNRITGEKIDTTPKVRYMTISR